MMVDREDPRNWIGGAAFAAVFGVEFLVFAIMEIGHLIIAVPLLLWSAYLLRRAWTAHRDVRILRAQELAGGCEKTPLRTRRQLQWLREQQRNAAKEERITRDASSLLSRTISLKEPQQ